MSPTGLPWSDPNSDPPGDVRAAIAREMPAPFDETHPVYQEIFELLVDQVAGDATPEAIERTFGVAQGVATMLIPGILASRLMPPPVMADLVSAWIWSRMEDAVRARP